MTKAEQFFYDRAGWGYRPDIETEEQGRTRGARVLAAAEQHAKADGMWFYWERDDSTNREFADDGPEYYLWYVFAYLGDDKPEVCGSLGGVDFGPDNSPNGGSEGGRYARVVEAELALEYYGDRVTS